MSRNGQRINTVAGRSDTRVAVGLLFLALLLIAGLAASHTAAGSTLCPTWLTFGEAYQCTIAQPGEVDTFFFDGQLGQRLLLRVMDNTAFWTLAVEVRRPDGTSICGGIGGHFTCLLDATGIYSVLVNDAYGTNTGIYGLYTQRLDAPSGCTPIPFGTMPETGEINLPAEADCFMVYGTAGDLLRLKAVAAPTYFTSMVTLFRPDGTPICGPSNTIIHCSLDVAGPHMVLLYPNLGFQVGTYYLYAQRMTDPVGCSAVTFGAPPVAATISFPGQANCYIFNGAVADVIRQWLVNTSSDWTAALDLYRPDGTPHCTGSAGSYDCILDATGLHTLLVRGYSIMETGDYSLYLQKLNDPLGCAAIRPDGSPVSGSIEEPAEIDCFTYDGQIGNFLRLEVSSTAGDLLPFEELVRPNGTLLCFTLSGRMDCSLDADGRHAILIRDASGVHTGAYRLTLSCLNPPCVGSFPAVGFVPVVLLPASPLE